MDTQALALTISGIVLPFVQEFLLKNNVQGKVALWINFGACVAIAAVATAFTGGFSGGLTPDEIVPKITAVFTVSQFVFHTIPGTVAKVGGTA